MLIWMSYRIIDDDISKECNCSFVIYIYIADINCDCAPGNTMLISHIVSTVTWTCHSLMEYHQGRLGLIKLVYPHNFITEAC